MAALPGRAVQACIIDGRAADTRSRPFYNRPLKAPLRHRYARTTLAKMSSPPYLTYLELRTTEINNIVLNSVQKRRGF